MNTTTQSKQSLKALLSIVAIALILGILVGCGGGGGGQSDPLRSRYQSLINAINNENLNSAMGNYSTDFLQECYTWFDVRDALSDLFSAPNYHNQLSSLQVTHSDIQGDFGYAEGTFHIREDDNGTISEDDVSFAMYFVREGNTWRLYGNQVCVGDTGKPMLDRRSKILQAFGANLENATQF